MPQFCCVVNCANRSNRDNVRFYCIPQILKFKHKMNLNELSILRHEKWLNAISRADLTPGKLKNARVCSRHFISGTPAKLMDRQSPDWVPSINMGYHDTAISLSSSKVARFQRTVKRRKVLKTETHQEVEPADVEDISFVNNKSCQTELTMVMA